MIGDGETEWVVDRLEGRSRPVVEPDGDRVSSAGAHAGNGAGGPELDGGATDPFLGEEPSGWADVLTGCDGPRFWDRIVTSEQARNLRHQRTATIVLVEFVGMDAIARRWGPDLALQLFLRLARVLASGIRSSDHIARIGRTRFAVLLVETDQVRAINFVDRIRERCEADVDPLANGFRIAIGWANPSPGGHLADAQQVAAERLDEDLHRRA